MATKVPSSEDERAGVQAMETGLQVLNAFVGAEPAPMLKTLAERAGMHPAKVHRYLVSLSRWGYVEQDAASGRYRLGPSALEIGYAAMRAIDVIELARPVVQALVRQHCHSGALAMWRPHGPIAVLQESYPAPITMSIQLGSVLPMLTSSTGRTFGAWLPREEVDRLVRNELVALRKRNLPGTPGTIEEVETMFEEIRHRGLARVAGQLNPAVNAMSAPVFDGRGRITAVLSLLGPASVFDSSWNGPIGESLRASARNLSQSLGWSDRHNTTAKRSR